MKKRIKKIASCILTFIFVLTPLMFTGCMSIVLDLLLGEEAGDSTYYLGGLYKDEENYVEGNALRDYLDNWKKNTDNLATAFRQEFGTDTNGDRNISGDSDNVKGRTDYFPDYKTLIGTSVEPKEIASMLYTYQYMVCYTVGITGDHFVLALTDNNEVTETTTNDSGEIEYTNNGLFSINGSNLEFDNRLIAVEDGKFVAKLDNSKGLFSKYYDNLKLYSYSDANNIAEDTVLYDMSADTGCKIFKFSYKEGKKTYSCLFVIGNTSDFILAYDDIDTGSKSLAESIENCLYQLYNTHYGLADYYWVFEKDQINLNINSSSFFRVRAEQINVNSNLKTNDTNSYGLAVDIMKELLVGDDTDSLKSFIPTSISLDAVNDAISAFVGNTSVVRGQGRTITAVSLYDIYNAVIQQRQSTSSSSYVIIKSEDNKETIRLSTSVEDGVEKFFIICSYQFFNGIWGFKDNDQNKENVVNAIVSGVIQKNNKDYTKEFTNFIRIKQGNLKAISAYLINNKRELYAKGNYNTGYTIASITGNEINDADESNANYKNFFSTTKRKYNSLIFEAWGRNYALNAISFQIEYLTEAEKELEEENGTESTIWQNIRDHYTFVVEKYAYYKDEKTGDKYMKKEASFAKKASEMFADDTIKSGFFFCYFKDMLANNKNALGSEVLSLDSVISDEKEEEFGQKRVENPKPFEFDDNNVTPDFYFAEYDDGTYGTSMVYLRGQYYATGEEFIQLIFAVDNEAYRIPFRFTSILMGG